MINCQKCDEPIPGEPRVLYASDESNLAGERLEPGHWYEEGSRYECPRCGVEHMAVIVSDDGIDLRLVEE